MPFAAQAKGVAKNMHLQFPELRGGTSQGLNDAGVENFQGDVNVHLSRECGQNTGDAPGVGVETVRLEFQRISVPASDIPAFDNLRGTLNACLAKWGHDSKAREFFESAIDAASVNSIPVLRVSDYGTTGLTGSDTDERSRWFALVKSQGVSVKDAIAGGSFGIGKSSPFAASRVRTVFYGTRTESGEVALQGVSRLVTHKRSDGRLTQGVGFIGSYDADGGEGGEPVFRAQRRETDIPPLFRRTEPGTDIWIIGYRDSQGWEDALTKSILTNFWPAIHQGSIEFRVANQLISRGNLEHLITQHSGTEDFEAHHYYRTILGQPITSRLRSVGDCELYLSTGDAALPKKVCMARQSGMRIYDYQPRACRVPFSGLFICKDRSGNTLLRSMEPPKHDTWDPKRIEGNIGKAALDEIKLWIREEVKKLNPFFTGNSFQENELAKYVPDSTPDPTTDLPSESTGGSSNESLEPRPREEAPAITPIKARPLTPTREGNAEGGFGEDPGTKGGRHADGTRSETPNPVGSGSANSLDTPKVHVRSYQTGDHYYTMVLRTSESFTGRLSIRAVGEDGTAERVRLTQAALSTSEGPPLVFDGDLISNVSLQANVPLRIALKLDASARRALTAELTS